MVIPTALSTVIPTIIQRLLFLLISCIYLLFGNSPDHFLYERPFIKWVEITVLILHIEKLPAAKHPKDLGIA
jgi:hypothetical protein